MHIFLELTAIIVLQIDFEGRITLHKVRSHCNFVAVLKRIEHLGIHTDTVDNFGNSGLHAIFHGVSSHGAF